MAKTLTPNEAGSLPISYQQVATNTDSGSVSARSRSSYNSRCIRTLPSKAY